MFASVALGPQSLEGELEMHGDWGEEGPKTGRFLSPGVQGEEKCWGGNESTNFNQQMPAARQ